MSKFQYELGVLSLGSKFSVLSYIYMQEVNELRNE